MATAARAGLITLAHPILQRLSRDLDETVDLAILDKGMPTFSDQVVAPQRLRTVSGMGLSFPLHCTANGKALLAYLSDRQIAPLLPHTLPALTSRTTTSLPRLLEDIAATHTRGYAVDREEHTTGICAIGVAIAATPQGPVAISVPLPVQRFSEKEAAVCAAP